MAYYNLSQTGGTNLHTTFRFELEVVTDANNGRLGLSDKLTAFVTSCDVPCAPGTVLPWKMPGGMRSWQAGWRETKDIHLEFVVTSDSAQSWIRTLEKWGDAAYDLETGNNAGKAGYSSNALQIRVKGEDGKTRYRFKVKRAIIHNMQYGTLSSEQNELLKISCDIAYDKYEIYDINNALIQSSSN